MEIHYTEIGKHAHTKPRRFVKETVDQVRTVISGIAAAHCVIGPTQMNNLISNSAAALLTPPRSTSRPTATCPPHCCFL
jgi:hypothetical protein